MGSRDATVLTWGAFQELKRLVRRQQRSLTNLERRLCTRSVRRHQERVFPPPRIRFKNTSGETAPAWAVMQMTGGADSDFTAIQKQDTSFNGLHLVNGNRAVADGAQGWGQLLTSEAYVSKRQFALYNTAETPAVGESWGPVSGSWLLHKNGPGFYIIGDTAGSGATARVKVVQYDTTRILGKTDNSVIGDDTVTVSVFGGASGSETDSGLNVADCRLRYGYVPVSTFVTVDFINGQPYIGGDHRHVIVQADANIAKGAAGTCSIYNGGADTGDNITATATGAAIESGNWTTAWHEEKSDTWYVGPWECP